MPNDDTCCIRIITLTVGGHSDFDGQYVKRYDPTYYPKGEPYDGGLLLVTPNRAEARQFESTAEALAYWRQSHGIGTNGKPNRPLTAFDVEIA